MRWNDVDYMFDGFTCTVVFDIDGDPLPVRKQMDGIILCNRPNTLPILSNPSRTKVASIPPYARVVNIQPDERSKAW